MADETYRNILETIALHHSATVTVFADFCRMVACCLAAGSREAEYLEAIKPYTRKDLDEFSRAMALLIQEMDERPFIDVLGEYYLNVAAHSSKQSRGEFYTPPEIAKLMAKLVFDVDEVKARGKPITVNEPACGSGGMVLAVAELFAPDSVDLLRVTAQDINPVAADMCYINLTLWGIPSRIVLGDTLRGTVCREWKNVHWFRVDEELRSAVTSFQDLITQAEEVPAALGSLNLEEARKNAADSKGQFLLDL